MFIKIIQVKNNKGLNSDYKDQRGILDIECVR